ncbi:DUF1127 domain-containing protein [Bradyrhizobium sp. LTSP857]|jgi:uncharacterized protein YjiS (DUF1127 family)|uniref:DUF1127 domain-containing protein n=1 Tax=Bradyrhizobium sp. LTSP857 TaxID=1619231 RepID=UPI0009E430F1|nr:DUF1127 domain-containing protein [Bradyrhizobium sp. LTSP857]
MFIAFLFSLIRVARERQLCIAELSQLHDRELSDLGIRRSDIQRVASTPVNALVLPCSC